MSYTESHIVQLSSIKADLKKNGSFLSDVAFSMQGLLKRDASIVSKQISVLHAQFPLTIYAINTNNNKIKYQIGTGTIYTSIIPEGNYTATTLISALNSAFLANSVVLTLTFSQITGKLTFTHLTSDFTFYVIDNSLMQVLGFTTKVNYSSSSKSLTGLYPVNILGALNFQIFSHNLITKNFNSLQGGGSTILATIPINTMMWGVAIYDNNTSIRNVLYNDVINNIDIQIYDNYGYLVNFNNSDWEITIVLDITYLDVSQDNSILAQPQYNPNTQDNTQDNPPDADAPNTDDMELYLLSQPQLN